MNDEGRMVCDGKVRSRRKKCETANNRSLLLRRLIVWNWISKKVTVAANEEWPVHLQQQALRSVLLRQPAVRRHRRSIAQAPRAVG